ncbi:MAG: methenyltetrahydromethanopterin cyclohydrolase [Candidatus Jordarchaeales archaeon]
MNLLAQEIVEDMMDYSEELQIEVTQTESGAFIVDAGVNAEGSILAGEYVTEICLGGLGTAMVASAQYGDLVLPVIHVSTNYPAISTLGAQFAGWRITDENGKFIGMGSGPARALALKPKKLYEKIDYRDDAEVAVLFLEANELPGDNVVKIVADACGVDPSNVYIVVAPTNSIVGSIQISGRVVETGIHKISEVGFDPKKIKYANGVAPIAPIHPDPTIGMGITNDMIIFAGHVNLFVETDNDDELKQYVEKTPSSTSKSYGKPFYETFKEANFDFYKIDPGIFAPASILVNNIKTGKTFRAGKIDINLLRKTIGL